MSADTENPNSSGYCTAMCNESSDEPGHLPLCAYHRDFSEEVGRA